MRCFGLLGGSWVVIGGVISPQIWVIRIVTLLITLLITTHEPPSMVRVSRVLASSGFEGFHIFWGWGFQILRLEVLLSL